MPACFVKNCKSRSDKQRLFCFPKEADLRRKWLEACQREDATHIKIDSARICSLHFKQDCLEMKWTQKRKNNILTKQMCRLKQNAIPTEMLHLVRKRKKREDTREETENKKIKLSNEGGSQSSTELEDENNLLRSENPIIEDQTIVTEKDRKEEIRKKQITIVNESYSQSSTELENLQNLLKQVEEEKTNLLRALNKSRQEQQKVIEINKQLRLEVELLKLNVQQKADIIEKIEINKKTEAKTIAISILSKVFTAGQIKLLMSEKEKPQIKWSAEDITSAIALRALSPKAYRYLRDVKKMPLPCTSTLQNWCATFNISPGILNDVLKIMTEKGQDLSTIEKLTVLTFDELYVSNKIDIERKKQKIYGPHKTCQILMARGLFSKWKQPIYYNFDTPMSPNILLTVIRNLYIANYIVVAVTCDMGSTNMQLWKQLNIGINSTNISKKRKKEIIQKQNYIVHPADNSLKIFFFADVPHLIKLARNNLFDSGFKVKGNIIDKNCLEELLTLNKSDLKIAHKLSQAHLDVKGAQRQNVKMASQIFSNTNAIALQWCGENNLLISKHWKETANVLKLFNDWFDIFNSKSKYGYHSGVHGYGINLEEQNKILNDMNLFIKELRIGETSKFLPFQKGILICNKSLSEMFVYIQDTFSSEAFQVEYLLTNKLNQDNLENLFSYLRMMGGGCDHPTPVQLQHRLKWYILGKHSGYVISPGENIAEDRNSTIFINIDDINRDQFPTCSRFIHNEDEVTEEEIFTNMSTIEDTCTNNSQKKTTEIGDIEEDEHSKRYCDVEI